jgi:ankyrin repeat protein
MIFTFDTNILLQVPSILRDYSNQIIISNTVFNELDYRKRFKEHQENAQLSIKHIKNNNLRFLPKLKNEKNLKNDEKIIEEILLNKQRITLVSEDEAIHVRAKENNIKSMNLQEFNNFILSNEDKPTSNDLEFFNLVKKQEFEKAEQFKINKKLNYNFITKDNLTPLIYFIRNRKKEELKFWINLSNVDYNKYDNGKFPMPPYIHAVQRNQLDTLKILINKNINLKLLSKGKNKGNSALLIAIWDNRINIVKYLLENKVLNISINQVDNNGFSPLIKASIKNRIEIIKYLLTFDNIDLNICDRDGKNARDWANELNNIEIIKLLNGEIK